MRGNAEESLRYIGELLVCQFLGQKRADSLVTLDTSTLTKYLTGVLDALVNLRGKNKLKSKALPNHLWNLAILTDAAISTSHTEADIFIKASDLDPIVFDRYCVYDVTHGMYRIFVEANLSYIERP